MNLQDAANAISLLAKSDAEAKAAQEAMSSNAAKSMDLHILIHNRLGIRVFVENAKAGVKIKYDREIFLFTQIDPARLVCHWTVKSYVSGDKNFLRLEVLNLQDLIDWYETNKLIINAYDKVLFPKPWPTKWQVPTITQLVNSKQWSVEEANKRVEYIKSLEDADSGTS